MTRVKEDASYKAKKARLEELERASKTEVTDFGSHTPVQPVDAPNEALRVLKAAAKATQQMPPLAPGYSGEKAKQDAKRKIPAQTVKHVAPDGSWIKTGPIKPGEAVAARPIKKATQYKALKILRGMNTSTRVIHQVDVPPRMG